MLTAIAVTNAAAREKDYKLADSGGLYLFVSKTGHRSWRLKYRFGGKERRLILGSFPETRLAQARDKRAEARRQLKEGKDPALVEKRRKLARTTPSALTFERFARDWHALQAPRWKKVHADDVIRSLERDVFPALGAHDVADIDEDMIHAILAKVEARVLQRSKREARSKALIVCANGSRRSSATRRSRRRSSGILLPI